MHTPAEIRENTIPLGRAYVRLIESSETVLDRHPAFVERLILQVVRLLYVNQLRRFVEALPPEVTAEILAASEKNNTPAKGFSKN
jgi:hypothetical protein